MNKQNRHSMNKSSTMSCYRLSGHPCLVRLLGACYSMVVAMVVLGFPVACAAIFGFDKLKETLVELGKQ